MFYAEYKAVLLDHNDKRCGQNQRKNIVLNSTENVSTYACYEIKLVPYFFRK